MTADFPGPESRTAGALLLIGGLVFLSGIIAAQSLFPGYSVSKSAISDLGAPVELAYGRSPGVLTIEQPASMIFVISVFLSSILILQAARLLRIVKTQKWFHRFLTLYGVGGLLVVLSYIPYYAYSNQVIQGSPAGDPPAIILGALTHLVGALFIFIFGGLSAATAYPDLKRPTAYLSATIGVIIVGAFALNLARVDLGLGNGGIERLAAYPLFLWTMGAGAYMCFSRRLTTKQTRLNLADARD